jgi:acetyltransferase-like isoleucine patch superfamily enzyme
MNQFRTFFKPSILDLLNTFYYRILGVKIGSKSYIMYPSKIIRFPKNVSIGKNTIIKPNVEICACNENSKISIGDFVSVGHYTFIYSSKKISIGNRVMVAPFCYLVDSNHDVSIAKGGLNGLNLVEEIKINDDDRIKKKHNNSINHTLCASNFIPLTTEKNVNSCGRNEN